MNESTRNGAAKPALEGVRVVDLSNFLAAPSASMYLADFGAEVIKFERPGTGDELRKWGYDKDGVGLYFKMINRNKKSVTADFHTPLGVEIVKRLVREADIVIENYRPGTLEKWGLGYDVLCAINPRIVLLRMTGYGQYGPSSGKPGFGTAMEAFSGGVYLSGYPDRPPLLPGFGLADSSAGLMGAFLAMVALRERDANSGIGQVIDLALYEPLFTLLGPFVIDYDQLGVVAERMGSRVPWTAPRNVYRSRDGRYASISGSGQAIFERLCAALDVPELASDERFIDHRARVRNVEELDAALQIAIERFDLDEVVARIEACDAVVAPVRSVAEIVHDPQIVARENVVSVYDEELGGPIRMQNVAGKLSRTPGKVTSSGPALGAHNAEIFVERLGFSRAELEAAGISLDPRGAPAQGSASR